MDIFLFAYDGWKYQGCFNMNLKSGIAKKIIRIDITEHGIYFFWNNAGRFCGVEYFRDPALCESCTGQ